MKRHIALSVIFQLNVSYQHKRSSEARTYYNATFFCNRTSCTSHKVAIVG